MGTNAFMRSIADEGRKKRGKNMMTGKSLQSYGFYNELYCFSIGIEVGDDSVKHPCLIFEFPYLKVDHSEL